MGGMVNFKAVKCIFSGPPRVGKTTVKRRLLKEIVNIRKCADLASQSTTMDGCTVPIFEKTLTGSQIVSNDEWKSLNELLDEGCIVVNLTERTQQQPREQQKKPPTPGSSDNMPPEESHSDIDDTDEFVSPRSKIPDKYSKLKAAGRDLYEQIVQRNVQRSDQAPPENIAMLYLLDTGGQPECHDILPLILQGPALHLVVFNLDQDLDEHVTIRFCEQTGKDADVSYISHYTSIDMIHQILSSLYSLKCMETEAHSAGSVAVLVGTHKDRLGKTPKEKSQKIEEIDRRFSKSIIDCNFLIQEDFLRCPESQDKKFFSIDNMHGDEKEMDGFRKELSSLIYDHFRPLPLPKSWLIFHIALRKQPGGVLTIPECEALAEGCYIKKEDVPGVLTYIHRNLGTLLYYESQPRLNWIVISDPNVLFRALADLIAKSFTGKSGCSGANDHIRRTGIVPYDRIKGFERGKYGKYLIALLKYLKVMVKVPKAKGYFLACLLKPEPEESFPQQGSLVRTPEQSAAAPSPLLIKFKLGHIPLGLFSALIVALVSKDWKLTKKWRYRNHVQFMTPFPADIIVRNSHLELQVTNEYSDRSEAHEHCSQIRKTIVSALKEMKDTHRHTAKAEFDLGFYCPKRDLSVCQNFIAKAKFLLGRKRGSKDPQHFIGCEEGVYDKPTTVSCDNPACGDYFCKIQQVDNYGIWFDNWKVGRGGGHGFHPG